MTAPKPKTQSVKSQPKPEAAAQVDETSVSPHGAPVSLDGLGLDLASLRLDQNYIETAGVEKLLTTVPIGKPKKPDFVRVHPEKRFDCFILKVDGEIYIVAPHLLTEVSGIAVPVSLRLAITRDGVVFLWPVPLPSNDGRRENSWHQTAREAAVLAQTRWVSVRGNQSLGAYDIFRGSEQLSEPTWPDRPFEEILEIAFRGRVIRDYDHPVLKKLRGEV